MNAFVSRAAFDELLRAHAPEALQAKLGRSKRAYEARRALANQAAWQLFARTIDALRICVAPSSGADGRAATTAAEARWATPSTTQTIQPQHVYNMVRLASLIDMPLRDRPASNRLLDANLSGIMQGGGVAGRGGVPTATPSEWLNASATKALLAEYKTRLAGASLRIGPAALALVRGIVQHNLAQMVREHGKGKKLTDVVHAWRMQWASSA